MIVFPLSEYVPSGLVSKARFCSVMKNPGQIAFTRKDSPNLIAISPAIYLVKLVTAALAAPYPATRVKGRRAEADEILMIFPFCSFTINSENTTVGITEPIRFRSTTLRKSSIFRSNILLFGPMVAPGIFPPAPFINTSIFPYFSTISSAFCFRTASSVTSVTRNMASPPLAFTFSISKSPFSLLRANTATFAPCAARYSTMLSPSTPVPPVMATTRSLISKNSYISFLFTV